MKKCLFGYKISDVNVIISALREENESLNTTITMLQTQIKNNVGEKNPKFLLLEEELETLKNGLLKITMEKEELENKIASLIGEAAITLEEYDSIITDTNKSQPQ